MRFGGTKMDEIQWVYSKVMRRDKASILDYRALFLQEEETMLRSQNELKELKIALKSVIGGDSLI